jgi:hypothetical protein
VDLSLFDEVEDALRGMVPARLGALCCRAHRAGVKVWFDAEAPPREHYEAQVIGPRGVPGATAFAIEIGFHAEHPKATDNDRALARLVANEERWRRALGPDAVAGPFLGRADRWRRVSETWPDPDLDDPGLAVELAARLLDYVTALEPLRRAR